MSLLVKVSSRAERDVGAIFEWLSGHSPAGAVRWYEAYLTTLSTLPVTALGSPRAAEAETLGMDLRQVFFRTRKGRLYRLLITLRGDVIHVVSIRAGGQKEVAWDDLQLPD